jgi:hypothetical protein
MDAKLKSSDESPREVLEKDREFSVNEVALEERSDALDDSASSVMTPSSSFVVQYWPKFAILIARGVVQLAVLCVVFCSSIVYRVH